MSRSFWNKLTMDDSTEHGDDAHCRTASRTLRTPAGDYPRVVQTIDEVQRRHEVRRINVETFGRGVATTSAN